MSNKKVRKPAAGAGAEFAKKHAEHFAKVYNWEGKPREDNDFGPDESFLSSLSIEEHEEWVQAGNEIRMQFLSYIKAEDKPIDTANALYCLDTCTQFLTQLVQVTTSIINTIDLRSLRQIVAADTQLPHNMRLALKSVGVNADELLGEEKEPEPADKNFRKRPRGARHPLMVMIGFTLQAVRLIQKITAGTNPDAQNLKDRTESDGSSVTLKMPPLPGLPGL